MKLDVSLEEILVVGAVLCALIIALGVAFNRIPPLEGGAIITSLCGGAVIAKVVRTSRSRRR